LSEISIQQVLEYNSAIGIASSFVSAHQPFGAYRADRLIGALSGQIKRRHYAFAVRDGTIIGYAGWALCTEATARAWLEDGRVPPPDQYSDGEIVVIVIVVADDTDALRHLKAHLRKLYRGRAFMARRASRETDAVRRGVFR
jgi:hemolysin-activating ACP:hemolysin acyltransferase